MLVQGTPHIQDYNYSDALSTSMQFFAAQRSGALGPSFTIYWRGDSGLTDNPIGGYYLGTSRLRPLSSTVKEVYDVHLFLEVLTGYTVSLLP